MYFPSIIFGSSFVYTEDVLSTLVFSLVLVSATPPSWEKRELLDFFIREGALRNLPTQEARDSELCNLAGVAYRVSREAGENTQSYARRILKARDPQHPAVRQDQWLLALIGRLYSDIAARSLLLARFENDRRDRQVLEQKGQESRAAADQIAGLIVTKIEGLDGFMQPLPIGEGEKSKKFGANVMIQPSGVITIETMDRVTFQAHQAPENVERTSSGAIRELYAALKQYNMNATMMARVEPKLKQGVGHVRLFIPAAFPATYLNELIRAAKEAGMHTAFIMLMSAQRDELRELPVLLDAKKAGRKETLADFRCKESVTMQACAEWALDNAKKGRLFYRLAE